MGGGFVGRLWPRDEDERQRTLEAGYDLTKQLDQDELVKGDDAFFSATGVTDGDFLQGVRYPSARSATTESMVMRSRTRTIRRVLARHDRQKMRALRADVYG
jgi:fructose-1,6-bisphosphatase II